MGSCSCDMKVTISKSMDLFLEELFILLRPSFTLVDASLHLLRHCDKFVALPPLPSKNVT